MAKLTNQYHDEHRKEIVEKMTRSAKKQQVETNGHPQMIQIPNRYLVITITNHWSLFAAFSASFLYLLHINLVERNSVTRGEKVSENKSDKEDMIKCSHSHVILLFPLCYMYLC